MNLNPSGLVSWKNEFFDSQTIGFIQKISFPTTSTCLPIHSELLRICDGCSFEVWCFEGIVDGG